MTMVQKNGYKEITVKRTLPTSSPYGPPSEAFPPALEEIDLNVEDPPSPLWNPARKEFARMPYRPGKQEEEPDGSESCESTFRNEDDVVIIPASLSSLRGSTANAKGYENTRMILQSTESNEKCSGRCRQFPCVAFIALFVGVLITGIMSIVRADEPPPTTAPPQLSPHSPFQHHVHSTAYSPTSSPSLNNRQSQVNNITNYVASVIGSESLANESSPFSMALAWMLNEDEMKLTTDSATFFQRLTAAYLYLATSEGGQRPWTWCGRATSHQSSTCIDQGSPTFPSNIPAFRWLSDVPECQWSGVYCDDQQQIRKIELHGANMTGPFPDGIRFLPFLQTFVSEYGTLSGPLAMGALVNMKHLVDFELPTQQMTGKVPSELWSMPNLRDVFLNSNQFTGTLGRELGQLSSCKYLVLYDNELSGTIPTEIGLLQNAYSLSLGENKFRGRIPWTLGLLKSLFGLYLSDNNLHGAIPTELANMGPNVAELMLGQNALTGSIPNQLYSLSLSQLHLYNNRLSGTLSESIGNWTNLSYLLLQNNSFYGSIPTELGLLTQLTTVLLSGNNFTGTMPASVCAERTSKRIFQYLSADCSPYNETGRPELTCATGCCTHCCDPVGTCSKLST